MTQQADDSTPNPVGNPLLDQLEIEFSDDLKIHLDETGERHRDEEREHHELIEHDYENPTTGFEFDYLQHAQPKEILPSVTGPAPKKAEAYKFRKASDVVEEKVPWLWKHRIPFGCLTILDGDPGIGKTTIGLDLMARLSNGLPMPFDDEQCVSMNSLVVSVEDSITYTIVPRLREAGADMSRVFVLIDFPLLPSGLERLRQTILETKARLIMVDPGLAMFDSTINANSDAETRKVVGGLAALAADTESAILFVRHLNKAQRAEAMYRGGGSIAISAAARSCLLAKFPRGKMKTPVLASYKSSLSLKPPTLTYKIVGNPTSPDHISKIEWLEEIGMTADEALEGDLPQERGRATATATPGGEDLRELGKDSRAEADVFAAVLLGPPEGMSQAEIQKGVSRGVRVVGKALDALFDAGKLTRGSRAAKGAGRPGVVWKVAGADQGSKESFE